MKPISREVSVRDLVLHFFRSWWPTRWLPDEVTAAVADGLSPLVAKDLEKLRAGGA
jgi:hypothetical protein